MSRRRWGCKRYSIRGCRNLYLWSADLPELDTLQIVECTDHQLSSMACVNRELMACYLCKCMLPTFITQLQYLKHIQVSFPMLWILFLLMKASMPKGEACWNIRGWFEEGLPSSWAEQEVEPTVGSNPPLPSSSIRRWVSFYQALLSGLILLFGSFFREDVKYYFADFVRKGGYPPKP